ncbi:MAG: site-specific DNA-methyltransferase [Candidatus Methanoperedens sp.]|nr:site-specific DNA-methyltransferase [Candidatus Methanoperedens sp.]
MAVLNFKGKTFVQNHHLAVKYHQLLPQKDKSQTDKVSLNDNLIIHGDNLKALKALLPSYAGKIKCIYIDPPYNTGNENWVYNDNVNSPMMQDWLGKVVDKEDFTRHDKWLCMMMPRLKLLRELLRDDGVIFVSIDDNEQHRLRFLMDEVFGEENFIANIIWQKKFSPQNDAKFFSDNHDFIVVYAKKKNGGEEIGGWVRKLLPRTEQMEERYSNPDNDHRGPWSSGDLSVKTYSKAYDYPITTPSGKIINPTKGRCWYTSKENLQKLIEDNRVWFGEKGDNVPRIKRFLSEVQSGLVPVTIWLHQDVGHNQQARQELKEIFLDVDFPFETPKPVALLKRILQLSTSKDSIILDSFAGSGTTAHAVLELNKEDSGNRKFILVECEDYADKITAERVRRVIKGVPNAKDETLKKGLGGTFSYFELGDPIEMESILEGKNLPDYLELARYVFYTATGEEFDSEKVDEKRNFIGESKEYEVYLFYKPDIEYLRTTALTLDKAKNLGEYKDKKRLVFAPSKYLDHDYLLKYRIDYCQLPFEIYKLKS